MHLSPYFFFFALLVVGQAQTLIDESTASLEAEDAPSVFEEEEQTYAQTPPMLYPGELEDLGPQYLLTPGTPAHDWLMALLDLLWLYSSNPTQAEGDSGRSADLRILTAQFGLQTPDKAVAGGQLAAQLGLRYQNFEYGRLSGDVLINGLPISNSDFDAGSVFSGAKWTRGPWQARAGLRWTTLNNDQEGSGYYSEWTPSLALSRHFSIGSNARLTVAYDGAYYVTKGVSELTIRDDFNDRYSNALSLRLLYRLSSKCFVEPNAGINYTVFTDDPNGDREDTTASLGLNLSYYCNKGAVLRLLATYQERRSTGVGIADYDNLEIGLGGTLSFQF
jgi:hypothetical protein